jgi:hypothetical protein
MKQSDRGTFKPWVNHYLKLAKFSALLNSRRGVVSPRIALARILPSRILHDPPQPFSTWRGHFSTRTQHFHNNLAGGLGQAYAFPR